MWAMIRRTIVPVFFLCGGVALFVYGLKFHYAPVVEEQEVQETIAVTPPFPLPPGFDEPPPFFAQPPPILEQVTRKVVVTKEEAEPVLIREVTVGGIALLASGELRRTYTGKPPSLCPT